MKGITTVGISNYHKQIRFGIKNDDRVGHIYCIGKTGSGKTTLLLNMALSDINSGNGIGIIDPHGDLSIDILDYIPSSRVKDVIYLNACDADNYISYNPLYNTKPEQFHLVASSIVSTFKKLWQDTWGPRLEHILRNSVLTLLYYP
jgi:hypothetical protein